MGGINFVQVQMYSKASRFSHFCYIFICVLQTNNNWG